MRTFPVTLRTIDAGGPIHFADFGGAGPPMVLVHGLGGSCENWLAVGGLLAEHARVLAVDLPGFGRTPPAGREITVTAIQRSLQTFLRVVVGEPAILVGNSMGGLVAMMQAAREPVSVAGLVLVAPAQPSVRGGRIGVPVQALFAVYAIPGLNRWFLRTRAARLGPEGLVGELLRLLCTDGSRVPEDVKRAHVALVRERLETMPWANDAFLSATRSLLATILRAQRYYRMVDAVVAPTLVIHGRDDRLVPLAASRALLGRKPDWTLETFDDIGHVPQLESPARFVDTVTRWLRTKKA
ncbi:MAG TPA: alpha/beta fold hydrolase [Methylomirabilota bacterium]|nr:alpha/beta fold hydrolase [Methylomirabilota bacterium]